MLAQFFLILDVTHISILVRSPLILWSLQYQDVVLPSTFSCGCYPKLIGRFFHKMTRYCDSLLACLTFIYLNNNIVVRLKYAVKSNLQGSNQKACFVWKREVRSRGSTSHVKLRFITFTQFKILRWWSRPCNLYLTKTNSKNLNPILARVPCMYVLAKKCGIKIVRTIINYYLHQLRLIPGAFSLGLGIKKSKNKLQALCSCKSIAIMWDNEMKPEASL